MLFLKPQRRMRAFKGVSFFLFFFCAVWILTSSRFSISLLLSGSGPDNGVTPGSNSTLGFGHIYVVSQKGSPRREGIIQAANVTELELSIPDQPRWTAKDERKFRLRQGSTIGSGSLLAWLGHLNALHE